MRRYLSISGLLFISLLVAGAIAADIYVRGLGPRTRVRVLRALSSRFNAQTDLASLQLTLLPRPSVSGDGLRIRREGDIDGHPFISISHFSAHSGIFDLLFQRDKVDTVRLEGLQIHIAPRQRSSLKKGITGNKKEERAPTKPGKQKNQIGIQTILADGTLLEIEPKQPGKGPLRFEIERLTMHSVSLSQALSFEALLQNAKPPGLIRTDGSFGPWDSDDPRLTPVSGAYSFKNADLGVFTGIRGILSSVGSYGGVLERMEVNGHTDVPQFALTSRGAPVHLQTGFHAVVNGTDGETILDPVDATFLNSEFLCRGGVVKKEGDQGKTVDLQAETKHARMEDILTLVLGDKTPILTGDTEFQSKILIPPGHKKVLDKLFLSGKFALRSAQFTSPKVEARLSTLSERARGIAKEQEKRRQPRMVTSDLLGTFRLQNGLASFSRLSFKLPGAEIRLTGNYGLRSRKIDMDGQFRMQATLAETQSGVKRLLLRALDPLFAKDGAGFEVPISINGTRDHPEIGVSVFHHAFKVK